MSRIRAKTDSGGSTYIDSEDLPEIDLSGSESSELSDMPDPTLADAGKSLVVNGTGDAYELQVVGGGGGGGSGWIYVEDVNAQTGSETGKAYQDSGNTVLQSVTVSETAIDVTVRASYPLAFIDGNAVTLTRDVSGGFYSGTFPVTISGTKTMDVQTRDANGGLGAEDSCDITVDAPPTITSAVFSGGYPGSQTELKSGDNFDLDVVADKNFDQVRILDVEACQAQDFAVASTMSTTVSVTIADRGDSAVARPVHLQVRDAVTGAYSPLYISSGAGSTDGVHVVTCNNLYPTATFGSITYPPTQSALKNSETATVAITLADQDLVNYDSPNLQLDAALFPSVTRIAGSYNVSTANLRVQATRNANNAVTTNTTVVNIANVAPTIDVSLPAARLRSGGNNGTSAQSHTITITSDQQLDAAPSMDADSGGNRGTFTGSWSGGPTVYTRSLTVDETTPDEKGVFTFESLSATGLSGLVQTTINSGASYTLGGFVARDLTFAAFATTTDIGTSVEDFSKLTADEFTATSSPALKQSIGTSPPVANGYTIDSIAVNPTELEWLDTTAAATNSTGTAQITGVEETA